LGGLWHGAGWTFVIWGLIQGIGVAVSHILQEIKLNFPRPFAVLLTFIFCIFSWVIFRAENLDSALHLYSNMLSISDNLIFPVQNHLYAILAASALIVFILPNTHQLIPQLVVYANRCPKVAVIAVILTIWLSLSAFDLDSSAEFIYFDF